MKFVILSLLAFSAVSAQAQDATKTLARIRSEYEQRFSSSNPNDSALVSKFSASQKAAINHQRIAINHI